MRMEQINQKVHQFRITNPKKTTLEKYPYVVYLRPVGAPKDLKRYFKSFDAAEKFVQEELSKNETSVANQTAEEILDYRNAQSNAGRVNMSLSAMVNLFFTCTVKVNNTGKDLSSIMQEYIEWREHNDPSFMLSTAIAQYLDSYLSRGKREVSKVSVKMCLMRLLNEIGDIPLVMLTADRIEKWVTTLRNKSRGVPRTRPRGTYVSLYTQHGNLYILLGFLSYWRKQGKISSNPGKKVLLPPKPKLDPKAYTPEDIAFAISLFEKHRRTQLYVCLAAFSGIRPTELGKLKWTHIDPEERTITLDISVTKTRRRRTVKIQDNLWEWLLLWKDFFYKDEFIFDNLLSTQIGFLTAYRKHRKVIVDGLRHSCASYLLALTQNSAVTAEQLGHDPAILKTHYMDLVRYDDAVRYFNIKPSNFRDYLKDNNNENERK